ncbi:hypothetical protein AVEN_220474-1 [Araneus ventricosus]|uniref:Uncharacterized protein n=1 Tax=Araneus ventricosus TaxID=182803 RepID=A0A4Y2J4M5_ARAVE|nr:hypothetical protein AVEN_220474-1 [Araneus ventricosus]
MFCSGNIQVGYGRHLPSYIQQSDDYNNRSMLKNIERLSQSEIQIPLSRNCEELDQYWDSFGSRIQYPTIGTGTRKSPHQVIQKERQSVCCFWGSFIFQY